MKQNQHKYIRRGDVYLADLDPAIGSEQSGVRPVVILQNNTGNKFSPTVIVAPFTSEIKSLHLPPHVYVAKNKCLELDSMAMLEQIRVLDKSRLLKFCGYLDRYNMERLNEAMRISLGMEEAIRLCLCPACVNALYSNPSIYRIHPVNLPQNRRGLCAVCRNREGEGYKIIANRNNTSHTGRN